MPAAGGTTVLQYPTHSELIGSRRLPASAEDAGLDAIIVPASRVAGNLQTAADLATDTGARLIVLCSLDTEPGEVRTLLARNGLTTAAVVAMPRQRGIELFDRFETTQWAQCYRGKWACGGRSSDLSTKRNTGLLLARMLGWRHIFFLDDDIRNVSAGTVLGTTALLGEEGRGYRTAGMSVAKYPDNSVVCHARREVGEFQDVFVSGSVLAVDCADTISFFPDLYNEDWLFFHRDAADARLAASGELAEQLPYDPFDHPRRAARQEFGDVIAEGLYALLHNGHGVEAAGENYWEQFLRQRKTVLNDVVKRLDGLTPDVPAAAISRSMRASKRMHRRISASTCADYVAAWRRDREQWERVLGNLRPASSVTDALGRLGLR